MATKIAIVPLGQQDFTASIVEPYRAEMICEKVPTWQAEKKVAIISY